MDLEWWRVAAVALLPLCVVVISYYRFRERELGRHLYKMSAAQADVWRREFNELNRTRFIRLIAVALGMGALLVLILI